MSVAELTVKWEALSPDGKAFQLLSEVLDGKYTVLISREVYEEYDEVLHREKFGFDEEIELVTSLRELERE